VCQQVLNFVRVAVQARKVNLLSIDEEVGTTQVLQVPIDSNLQEFTVSVSGENPKIILKDPSGKSVLFFDLQLNHLWSSNDCIWFPGPDKQEMLILILIQDLIELCKKPLVVK
jgi:hypothetical protein